MYEIGFDAIERSVVDRESVFLLLFLVDCRVVDVFLFEVPSLKPRSRVELRRFVDLLSVGRSIELWRIEHGKLE
jgi:hypothetical protein